MNVKAWFFLSEQTKAAIYSINTEVCSGFKVGERDKKLVRAREKNIVRVG